MASRNVFDLSAYSSLESANILHQSEMQILELASRDGPQPFELFMEQLAQSGRLHRHYTQNIDCRTSKLPALSQRTINIHGQLDRLRCHVYAQHKVSVQQQQSLQEMLGSRCPICDEMNEERSREGKRLHSVGFLRPDALLYNEGDGADPQIMNAFKEDLRQNVDAVIIVGTTLHIPLLQDHTTKLCKRIKWPKGEPIGDARPVSKKGMILWISKEKPKTRAKLRSLIDFEFLQDCDEFAVQISRWLGNLKGKIVITKRIIIAKHQQISHLVPQLRQKPMLRMKGNTFPNKSAQLKTLGPLD
jgi:NAD-dependent SIR2 family protein deacetylase